MAMKLPSVGAKAGGPRSQVATAFFGRNTDDTAMNAILILQLNHTLSIFQLGSCARVTDVRLANGFLEMLADSGAGTCDALPWWQSHGPDCADQSQALGSRRSMAPVL